MADIKVLRATLDVITVGGHESFAVRGQIDPHSLKDLQIPVYQREVLGVSKISSLSEAMKKSRVPEIDLGMRGESHTELPDGTILLHDPVNVIDGLQRTMAGRGLVEAGETFTPLGALIHFNTTEDWEYQRFTALNTGQTGLSNNVMLRNYAQRNEGARVMYGITQSETFVLHDKVTWTQNMRVGDLLTAITYYKVVGRLMSHTGPGKSGPIASATGGIDKMITAIGRNNFTHNVKAFFALIDDTFGIRNVAYRNRAVQLKSTFLMALAGVISDHETFWDEKNRLEIPADFKKRLRAFPTGDPAVKDLAGSAGKAVTVLEVMLVDHLNSRRTTRRLKRRQTAAELMAADGEE